MDKIGEVIGPKGKMINQIQDDTGADITIEDDGTIYIGAADGPSAEAARDADQRASPTRPCRRSASATWARSSRPPPSARSSPCMPGKDGLLHISQIRKLAGGKRVENVEDVVEVGDKVQVEIAEIDSRGKLSLIPVIEDERRRHGGRRRPATSPQLPATARPPSRRGPVARTRTRQGDGDGIVRRTVLPGGLRVVTEAMPTVRSVAFGIWVGVGSRDETPTLTGATHYLEHLLFKGTQRRDALDDLLGHRRGRRRDERLHRQGVHLLLRAGARQGPAAGHRRGLRHASPPRMIARRTSTAERGVILEEIAMHEDDPGDVRARRCSRTTMFGDTPLGRPVLGTVESINALTPGGDRRLLPARYRPQHMVVAAAGNVDHATVVRHVRAPSSGAGMPAGTTRLPVAPARRPGRRTLRDRRPGPRGRPATEQANVVLGVRLSRTDERRFALGVLNTALGGGMSSRLFQEVREKRGLAYSRLLLHRAVRRHRPVRRLRRLPATSVRTTCSKICRDELDRVAEHGIGDEELARGKGQLRGSLVLGLEDTGVADEPHRQERAGATASRCRSTTCSPGSRR